MAHDKESEKEKIFLAIPLSHLQCPHSDLEFPTQQKYKHLSSLYNNYQTISIASYSFCAGRKIRAIILQPNILEYYMVIKCYLGYYILCITCFTGVLPNMSLSI